MAGAAGLALDLVEEESPHLICPQQTKALNRLQDLTLPRGEPIGQLDEAGATETTHSLPPEKEKKNAKGV